MRRTVVQRALLADNVEKVPPLWGTSGLLMRHNVGQAAVAILESSGAVAKWQFKAAVEPSAAMRIAP
jgi:hypothetical protein